MNKYLKWLTYALEIVAVVFIVDYFGYKGAWGVLIVILAFVGYRLLKNKDSLMTSIRYIESRIWEKPLDKAYWEKGELKNTKVKFVWKK